MKLHISLLVVAGLSLAACATHSTQNQTGDASIPDAKLTVRIVEASGGA